jgi:hypothetical protein
MLESLPIYVRWEIYKLVFASILWFGSLLFVFYHPWFKLEKYKVKQNVRIKVPATNPSLQ